jgi:hypothetical protein
LDRWRGGDNSSRKRGGDRCKRKERVLEGFDGGGFSDPKSFGEDFESWSCLLLTRTVKGDGFRKKSCAVLG